MRSFFVANSSQDQRNYPKDQGILTIKKGKEVNQSPNLDSLIYLKELAQTIVLSRKNNLIIDIGRETRFFDL